MMQPSLQIKQQLRVARSSQETDHILAALVLSWTSSLLPGARKCELMLCVVDEVGACQSLSSRDRRVFISKFTARRKASASSVACALGRSWLLDPPRVDPPLVDPSCQSKHPGLSS